MYGSFLRSSSGFSGQQFVSRGLMVRCTDQRWQFGPGSEPNGSMLKLSDVFQLRISGHDSADNDVTYSAFVRHAGWCLRVI